MNGLVANRRGSFGNSLSLLRKSAFSALPEVPVTSESPEMVSGSIIGRSTSPDSALFDAIRQQRFRQATLLLEAGADPNARSRDCLGETALIYCCKRACDMPRQIQTKFAKLLLDHGADANLSDDRGLTPLMHASILGLKELANALLERDQTDPSMEDHDGNTAVMYAAMFGRRDILISIIEKFRHTLKSVQLDKKNKQGRTALNLAIRGQHESCVRLLMKETRHFPLVALEFPDPNDLDRGPTPGTLADDEDTLFDSSVELEEFEPPKLNRPDSITEQASKDVFLNESKRHGESFWVYKFDGNGNSKQRDTKNFPSGNNFNSVQINTPPAVKNRRKIQSKDHVVLNNGELNRKVVLEPNVNIIENDRPLTVVPPEMEDRGSENGSSDAKDDETGNTQTVVKDSVVWHKSLRRFNKRCSRIYNSESLPCIVLATGSTPSQRMVRKRASWTSGSVDDHQFDLKALIPKLKSSLGFHENVKEHMDSERSSNRRNSMLSGTIAD